MATQIITKGLTRIDYFVAWTMIVGLAVALLQYAHNLALPAHFV